MKLGKISLISLTVGVVVTSSFVFAEPQSAFYRTYYTDAAGSTVAGTYYQGCTSSSRTGTITPYYDENVLETCYNPRTSYPQRYEKDPTKYSPD